MLGNDSSVTFVIVHTATKLLIKSVANFPLGFGEYAVNWKFEQVCPNRVVGSHMPLAVRYPFRFLATFSGSVAR